MGFYFFENLEYNANYKQVKITVDFHSRTNIYLNQNEFLHNRKGNSILGLFFNYSITISNKLNLSES